MENKNVIIEKIKSDYLPKEITDFDRLKTLDKKVKRPAKVFAYIFGSLSSLVLGAGMCVAMKVIAGSMALGVIVGLSGIALCAITYPIYKAILKARKNKYSKEIFELSDNLLNK